MGARITCGEEDITGTISMTMTSMLPTIHMAGITTTGMDDILRIACLSMTARKCITENGTTTGTGAISGVEINTTTEAESSIFEAKLIVVETGTRGVGILKENKSIPDIPVVTPTRISHEHCVDGKKVKRCRKS